MADIIQMRRDSSENWTEANPILAQGEPALETDTKKEKLGDGVTAWVDLGYRFLTGGSDLFLGTFLSLAALTTAHPTPLEGSTAVINPAGSTSSDKARQAIWDTEDGEWVLVGTITGMAAEITAAASQPAPLDASIFGYLTSAGVLVKTTWLDLKNTLKIYFDTLYLAKTAIRPRTRVTYTGVSGTQNIDFALSIEFRIVMVGATTITFSNYDKALGETTAIYFTGAVPTWPATVNVVPGSETPLAAKRNYAVLNVFDAGSGTEVVDFMNKIMKA